ncbi:MAG: AAA family ATPase [Chloroflexi bacterium]|nr:AAA family ATPase [Chloroflexota bacterium]
MNPQTRSNTWIDLLRRLAPLLPIDLFGRLRNHSDLADLSTEVKRAFADDLQRAIYALGSLHHTLTNFLPRYLLNLSLTPGQPHGELLEGSFIFADVTGFTALTAELSKQGTEGLEEMNRLMSALFGALIDPLLDSGGDLLIFAGDAVLACFPARPEQPQGQDARWATRTALRLVEAIADFGHIETPYGDFSLTMSAGVERGLAFAAAVGTRQRMELLISGGPVQGAMRTEEEADPGQVTVGPGILPFLPSADFDIRGSVVAGIQGGELDDYEPVPPSRRRRISTIFSRRIPDLIKSLQHALSDVELLSPFIPPVIFAQIAQKEDFRQHPPVAIQFVNVLGIEDLALGRGGPELATAVLQRYFVQAQGIVTDRRGILNQMDPYAKGFILLNPFGAPTHHEGAPGLAASAVLELGYALERVNQEFSLDPPLIQRTGLTYDRIFTGEIGHRQRREYVVAGSSVNLAARLMSKAEPGQIVLDPTAWQAIQRDFRAETLPPIPLKGIAEPVPRFALQGIRRGKGLHLTDHPLTGRQEQLAVLEERLAQAIAGRGSVLALMGKAGIGKSRLIAALTSSAQQQGMMILTGRCRPFTQTTPYLPWDDLVTQWFELDKGTPAQIRQQTQTWLAQLDLAPSFSAFVDLLGLPPIVDLTTRTLSSHPDRSSGGLFAALQKQTEQQTEQTQNGGLGWSILAERVLEAEGKPTQDDGFSIWKTLQERAAIPQALHLALERQARRQPTLLIIEDIQWMDPDSYQVLNALLSSVPEWPLFLLVTARPETDWLGDQFLLPPLSDSGSRSLAALVLGATQLETELADWLLARAGGSPLFILAYCQALLDADAIVVNPENGEAQRSGPPPPIPLSLQELLLAQVDRLGRKVREVLRRGSVIGVTFPTWLITRLCGEILPSTELEEALDHAARRNLVAPPPPDQAHTFSSHSLHDAIYDTLSHALRREWHEQAGDHLTQADKAIHYERLEQIAHHYGCSNNTYKAAHFTRLAGDKSRARQADEAALAFYNQTLAVSDRNNMEVAIERQQAHEGVGDIQALRGEGQAAITAYQAALLEIPDRDTENVRLRAKLAILAPLIDPVDVELLEGPEQMLPPADSLRIWLRAARVWIYAGRGQVEVATRLCRDLLPVAEEPIRTLLQELLESIEGGLSQSGEESLPPYEDFIAFFAQSCLRESGEFV